MADECVICGEAVEGKPLYKKLGSGEFNVEVITALHALQLTRLPESAKNDSYICWDCDEIIVGEYSSYLENEKKQKEEAAKVKQVKKQHRAQQRKRQLRQNQKKQKATGTVKQQSVWTVQQPEVWHNSVKSENIKLSKTKLLEQKRASNAYHNTHCILCDSNFESRDRGYQRLPLKKRVNDELDIAQVMEQLGLARHIEPKMKGRRFVCNPCFVIIRRNYKNKLMKGTSIEGSSSCSEPMAPAGTLNPIHRATTEEHAAEIAKLLPPALAECYKILTSDCMSKKSNDTNKLESRAEKNGDVDDAATVNTVTDVSSSSDPKALSESVPEEDMDEQGAETEAEEEESGLNVSQDEHGNYFIDMDVINSPSDGDDSAKDDDRSKELPEENQNEASNIPRTKKNVMLPKRLHHHLSSNHNDDKRQLETLSPTQKADKTPETGKDCQDGSITTAAESDYTGICNICAISFTGKPQDWWYMLNSPLSGFESISVSMALKLLETSLAHSSKEACDARQVCSPCYGKVSAGFRSQVVQRIARQKNINASQVNLSKVKVRMVPKEELPSVLESQSGDAEETLEERCGAGNNKTGEFEKENMEVSDRKGQKRKYGDAEDIQRKSKRIKNCTTKASEAFGVKKKEIGDDNEIARMENEAFHKETQRSILQKAVYVTKSRRKIKLSPKILDVQIDDDDIEDFIVSDDDYDLKINSRQCQTQGSSQNNVSSSKDDQSYLSHDNSVWNDSGGETPRVNCSNRRLRLKQRHKRPKKVIQKSKKPKAVVVLKDLKFVLPHEAFGGKAVSAVKIEGNMDHQTSASPEVNSSSHSMHEKPQDWITSSGHTSLLQSGPGAYSSPLQYIFNSLSNSLQPSCSHSKEVCNPSLETELTGGKNLSDKEIDSSLSCISGRCVVCGCNYSVQREFWHNIDENIKPPTLMVPVRWVCVSLSVDQIELSQRDRDDGKVCRHCFVRLAKQFEKFVKTKVGESCGMTPISVDLSEYLITFNKETMNIEADPKQHSYVLEFEDAGQLLMKILPVIQSFSIDDIVGKGHRQPLDIKDFSTWLLLVLNELRIQTGAGIGDLAEWLIRLMPTEMYDKGLRPCRNSLASFLLSVTKSSDIFTKDKLSTAIPPEVFIFNNQTPGANIITEDNQHRLGLPQQNNQGDQLDCMKRVTLSSTHTIESSPPQESNQEDRLDCLENDRENVNWEDFLTIINIDDLMKGRAKPLSVKQFNNGVLYAMWRVSQMLGEDDHTVVEWLKQLSPVPLQKDELEKVVASASSLHNYLEKHPGDVQKLKREIIRMKTSGSSLMLGDQNSDKNVPVSDPLSVTIDSSRATKLEGNISREKNIQNDMPKDKKSTDNATNLMSDNKNKITTLEKSRPKVNRPFRRRYKSRKRPLSLSDRPMTGHDKKKNLEQKHASRMAANVDSAQGCSEEITPHTTCESLKDSTSLCGIDENISDIATKAGDSLPCLPEAKKNCKTDAKDDDGKSASIETVGILATGEVKTPLKATAAVSSLKSEIYKTDDEQQTAIENTASFCASNEENHSDKASEMDSHSSLPQGRQKNKSGTDIKVDVEKPVGETTLGNDDCDESLSLGVTEVSSSVACLPEGGQNSKSETEPKDVRKSAILSEKTVGICASGKGNVSHNATEAADSRSCLPKARRNSKSETDTKEDRRKSSGGKALDVKARDKEDILHKAAEGAESHPSLSKIRRNSKSESDTKNVAKHIVGKTSCNQAKNMDAKVHDFQGKLHNGDRRQVSKSKQNTQNLDRNEMASKRTSIKPSEEQKNVEAKLVPIKLDSRKPIIDEEQPESRQISNTIGKVQKLGKELGDLKKCNQELLKDNQKNQKLVSECFKREDMVLNQQGSTSTDVKSRDDFSDTLHVSEASPIPRKSFAKASRFSSGSTVNSPENVLHNKLKSKKRLNAFKRKVKFVENKLKFKRQHDKANLPNTQESIKSPQKNLKNKILKEGASQGEKERSKVSDKMAFDADKRDPLTVPESIPETTTKMTVKNTVNKPLEAKHKEKLCRDSVHENDEKSNERLQERDVTKGNPKPLSLGNSSPHSHRKSNAGGAQLSSKALTKTQSPSHKMIQKTKKAQTGLKREREKMGTTPQTTTDVKVGDKLHGPAEKKAKQKPRFEDLMNYDMGPLIPP
nr:uncharacterized protein LOC123756393 [Procambarus clarkii]